MRFVTKVLLAGVVVGLASAPCSAQLADLMPGARIRMRVATSSGLTEGTIIARGADSMVVATLAGVQHRVSIPTLASVDLYRGRSRVLGARKGALWGIAIGGIPLVLAYVAAHPSGDRWSRRDQLHFTVYALSAYAYTGALVGAGVRGDVWQHCSRLTAPTCDSRP